MWPTELYPVTVIDLEGHFRYYKRFHCII